MSVAGFMMVQYSLTGDAVEASRPEYGSYDEFKVVAYPFASKEAAVAAVADDSVRKMGDKEYKATDWDIEGSKWLPLDMSAPVCVATFENVFDP